MKRKPRKRLSEKTNVKQTSKKLNPFEVHINKKKYDVLGMKLKTDRGLPGISRSKAIRKRKATLLQEYKVKDKKNVFADRRIGERNNAMTNEDKIIARYAAERMKVHSKKSMFNLGDDEELTHRGQSLAEIEKFDDPKSDDDEDEQENGRLDSEFVGDAHFGGGILKKVDGESKSRKDLIEQLIAESKKRKAEKQKIREQTLDLTQKLDSEWKELLPLVTASKKQKTDIEESDYTKDQKSVSYDVMSKQLKFETKGKPTDRLKSEEEIAKEEKERLERLEQERIERMHGANDEGQKKTPKHRSADDLDDGFEIADGSTLFVEYNADGSLKTQPEKNSQRKSPKNKIDDDSDDSEDYKSTEGGEVVEEEKEEGKHRNSASAEENENEEEDEDDISDGENSIGSIDLSDLKESDESGVENADSHEVKAVKLEPCDENTNASSNYKTEEDYSEKIKNMEKARQELPYTFEIPENYEGFEKLMEGHNADFQAVIIERMVKCNHPSLKENHKEKLETLFTFLLQHLQDCSTQAHTKSDCFRILDRLAPWFYDLTQWSPDNSAGNVQEVIQEKYDFFLKDSKTYPTMDTLIFLELTSIIFPTSDFRHSVVTPCLIFMEHMLSSCRISSSIDVCAGLLTSTLVLEYCTVSKRFLPAALNFIRGVLRLTFPKKSTVPVIPPFRLQDMDQFTLEVFDKSKCCSEMKLSAGDLIQITRSDEFKIKAVNLAIQLLSQFCDFWEGEPAARLIFEPFIPLLDVDHYNDCLRKSVEEVLNKILNLKKDSLEKLVLEKKKPKPLRLYEPRIEAVYNFKKQRPMSKEKQEREKLVHKYKREMKGALREIRRDRSFIAKLKIKETQKSDAARQQKVREIYGSAAQQAGVLRKLKRQK